MLSQYFFKTSMPAAEIATQKIYHRSLGSTPWELIYGYHLLDSTKGKVETVDVPTAIQHADKQHQHDLD